MGARHKMARTLLTVMAAVALSLACADPTPATTAAAVPEAPLTPDSSTTTIASATPEAPLTTLSTTTTIASAPPEAPITTLSTTTTIASAPPEAPLTTLSTTTTTAAVSESPTASIGPQTSNFDNYTGTWWTYLRRGIDRSYSIVEIEITRNTPEDIAVYEQSWLSRNNSQNETNRDRSDSINWQKVSFACKMTNAGLNDSYTFLIEVSPDASHFKALNPDGRISLMRFKYTNGTLILHEVSRSVGTEFNFYRTLPDLATYAHCENFDIIDASDVFDFNSLVGTWTTDRPIRRHFFALRVTSKTAEEISAYRDDLRNTTVEEADIDWTKVRLQAELGQIGSEVRAVGLIEELDKPGSIRVIPLKETWDDIGRTKVENWFTNQTLIIKRDDGLLAVKNCNGPLEMAYFVRRPQQKRRKMPWKPKGGMGGKKKNY